MDNVTKIALFITHNRNTIIDELLPLLMQRAELLKTQKAEDIEESFEVMIRRVVADYVSLALDIAADEVYAVVEKMDVKEFLKGVV